MSKFKGSAKWKLEESKRTNAGPSIRGKPISNPIPLTEDDEFPIRTPGAGIATPLGTEGVEGHLQLRASAIFRPASTAHSQNIPASESAEPSTVERTAANTPAQSFHALPFSAHDQSSSVRNSRNSKALGSSDGRPQRKKSSLRSVFGRLFGKKQKINPSTSPRIPERSQLRAGHHRSVSERTCFCVSQLKKYQDPTALNRTTKLSTQRSASLPINEYNRALRSHSTNAEVLLLGNSAEANSVEADHSSVQEDSEIGKRRATTSSRLWMPNRALGYVDWTGLSPRPASSHARGSRFITDEDASSYIGVAVTSGSHPNRRSRSAGELRETASTKAVTRRRSDEIRYWRESYNPSLLSPISSHKVEAEDPTLIDELEEQPHEEPESTPQPFNFGPLGEIAGMKITQAASLETRVLRLEKQMREMEKIVSRSHIWTSTKPLVLQDPPKRNSFRDRSSSATRPNTNESEMSLPLPTQHRGHHHAHVPVSPLTASQCSRPSTTSTSDSYHPSLENGSAGFEESDLVSSQISARPLSTSTTIRGIPSSSPIMPKDGNLTAEHYTSLTNMILAERAARQSLEAMVHDLQQQLRILRSSTAASYIAPGPDQPASLKESARTGEGFSTFEQDDSSDDEGGYRREDFQTPNEESSPLGDEIFGEPNGNKEAKSPPRTLSLSQMTLGTNLQADLKV